MNCVGEVGVGARLWIVGARFGLARGCELCRRGWGWCEAVNCVGEVGVGARLWFVSAGVGLAQGCELARGVIETA